MKTSLHALLSWQAVVWLFASSAILQGCGSGTVQTSGSSSANSPAIVSQPANVSVPAGLSGSFSVTATGVNLGYQWFLNGVAVVGATSSTYTTPVVAYPDSGQVYTVTVSNGAGSASSVPATLTVTARAPVAGDLRFRFVDSPYTASGYTFSGGLISAEACALPGQEFSVAQGFSQAPGTPLILWNSAGASPVQVYSPLPVGVSSVYVGGSLSDLTTLLSPAFAQGFTAYGGSDPHSILSAAIVPANEPNCILLSWFSSASSNTYSLHQGTVDASALGAAASQEAAQGRVVTAMYILGSQITYFAYSWTGDASGIYETQVVTGSLDQVPALIAGLAGEGYILTGSGSTQAADGSCVYLVGTRFKGDATPRPFLSVQQMQFQQLLDGGYAIVAWAQRADDPSSLDQIMGER